ncbi:MAG: acylphosphatase [Dehalococcoidia bacterium]|nr:acylphosphatase [Dehalococcoidia bacterium]
MTLGGRKALTAIVRGRVQGVLFRDFVWRTATGLGLSGVTRNLPDGASVEVEAEGDATALEQLVERLREGPPRSRVDAVEVTWREATGATGPFEIVW